jgi:hypothetical protein
VDHRLRDQHAVGVVVRVDEGLQQVDRADADDGGGQLHLEHRGVHVAQPLGLVAVAFQVHAAHEGLVAAHDHHDQQVGDHHHVDQRQHHQHDHRLVERADRRGGLVADAGDQGLQRGLAAERGFDQVQQLDQEVHHVHRLRDDQAQVQRQLQPAAGEDQLGQRPIGTVRVGGGFKGSKGSGADIGEGFVEDRRFYGCPRVVLVITLRTNIGRVSDP